MFWIRISIRFENIEKSVLRLGKMICPNFSSAKWLKGIGILCQKAEYKHVPPFSWQYIFLCVCSDIILPHCSLYHSSFIKIICDDIKFFSLHFGPGVPWLALWSMICFLFKRYLPKIPIDWLCMSVHTDSTQHTAHTYLHTFLCVAHIFIFFYYKNTFWPFARSSIDLSVRLTKNWMISHFRNVFISFFLSFFVVFRPIWLTATI